MIVIFCPLKQDYIIELLTCANEEVKYELAKKDGMRLYFRVMPENIDAAIAHAKRIIKNTDIGKVLNFQIKAA